jgi:rhodanese-related sulfurtransferase
MKKRIFLVILFLLSLSACNNRISNEEKTLKSYMQISQEEARRMMDELVDYVIVDVRRKDEYDQGHIPNAILISNESIDSRRPEQLPDLDQIILVYCRSGNRSKQAAQKLSDMGYTNVYEFGGINTWNGEIVTEENRGDYKMKLYINEQEVPVNWEENDAVKKLKELMPLTISMSMYGGFEQVGYIGQSLPRDDSQITTSFGDIVLYSGDQIVIFYGSNSWSYTRLGHIDLSQKEMSDLLGNGDVSISLTE